MTQAPRAIDSANAAWRCGLAARSTLVVGALLAALGVGLSFLAAHGAEDAAAVQIEAAAARAAERLAEETPADESGTRFASLADGLGAEYALIAADDGSLVAGAAPVAPPAAFSAETLARSEGAGVAVVAVSDGVAHAAKLLRLADGARATVRVGLSTAPAAAAFGPAFAAALLATLGFLGLALPAFAVIADRAAAPLRALARAIARQGDGVGAVRRAGERRDEIGALARAHLSMAKDLADSADALHHLTFEDALTRLPNRASLTSRLAAALQVGRPVALLKLEVEGLTRIAAGLGQQQGDEAVRAAATRLRDAAADWTASSGASAFDADAAVTLARISDASFAMLAYGAGAASAADLARRAVEAFDAPVPIGERLASLQISVGIALGPDDGDEAGALIRSAAAAQSDARAAGPRSVRAAGADLNRKAYGRIRVEEELRRALVSGEIEVFYQPQIEMRRRTVSGAEALVRWRHPMRGLVSPAEFIPVAEDSGLVAPLGQLVLAEACRRSVAWRALGVDVRIAVNVSTLQFRSPRFAESALEIIAEAGADPSRIELEITESAAMGDPGHAARELARLKGAGVRIAIDDFGTGYSNLATLTQLPFDVLKIDRGFIRDAHADPAARVVVQAVIGMAASLGVEVVAEGVETGDQLAFVASQGCDFVQGFLFGKPMPAPAFEAWYANRMLGELRDLGRRGAADSSAASVMGALTPSFAG